MIGYVLQAFPLSENLTVGAESRKYQIDSAIMSTVILDLQVAGCNLSTKSIGTKIKCVVRMFEHVYHRAGFQMLTSTLDPSFTLSSDWYYRGLLAKVCVMLLFLLLLTYSPF